MESVLEKTCMIDLAAVRHVVLCCPHCGSELRIAPGVGQQVSDLCAACGRRMEGLGGHAQDVMRLIAQLADGVPHGRLYVAAPARD